MNNINYAALLAHFVIFLGISYFFGLSFGVGYSLFIAVVNLFILER